MQYQAWRNILGTMGICHWYTLTLFQSGGQIMPITGLSQLDLKMILRACISYQNMWVRTCPLFRHHHFSYNLKEAVQTLWNICFGAKCKEFLILEHYRVDIVIHLWQTFIIFLRLVVGKFLILDVRSSFPNKKKTWKKSKIRSRFVGKGKKSPKKK